jgi:hypothetical protein
MRTAVVSLGKNQRCDITRIYIYILIYNIIDLLLADG